MSEFEKSVEDDDALASEVYKTNLVATLGGQLFVHDVELEQAGIGLVSGEDVPFFRLPFKEAIEHFTSKGIMDFGQFEELDDAERFRSFAVKRSVSNTMTKQIKSAIDRVMVGEGGTLRDFIAEFRDRAPGFTSQYLENVMRTTTSSSYNSGRKRAQEDRAVVEALPFWQYLTAGDSRVRPEHADLHEKVWPASEFPQEIYPPNGYNCRCIVVSRSAEQAKRFKRGATVVVDDVAQEGFAAPPDSVVRAEAALG